jgi:hypothetical protein
VNPIEIVRQWLTVINQRLGTEFALTEEGRGAIEFDNRATLFFHVLPEESSVVLYAPLQKLDAQPDVLYLLGVLGLNLSNSAIEPGRIGYDAERHTLVYSERIDLGSSNAHAFASRLDRFPMLWSRLQDTLTELNAQAALIQSDARRDESAQDLLPQAIDPRILRP